MRGKAIPLPANPEPPDTICIPVELPYDFANPQDSLWWIATFTGQLRRLGYRFEYQSGETDAAFRTARTWRAIVDQIHARSQAGVYCDDLDQPVEGEGCFSIGAFHPAISYFPNHPVLSPDYVAPAYSAPAWVKDITLPGYQATDAMINPLSLDLFANIGDLLESGVPSWTLNFSGTGEVDVKFMAQIQGGMVWVFPDGNPLVGDLVDLNWRDLTDFASTGVFFEFLEILQGDPGIFEVEYSVNFTTPGDHTLTAWYIPIGEAEAPWVGIGGGLRSIQLCGEITVNEDAVMPYDLNLDGCNLQLRLDLVVVDTIDLTPCIEAIAQPVLRDNGCQLQVFDFENEVYEDVPGASYFRTQADCPITDTVEIEKSVTNIFTALDLQNLNPTAHDGSGAGINFYCRNLTNTKDLQAYAVSKWGDIATRKGRINIGVGNAGVAADVMRISAGNQAVTVLRNASLGHNQIMRWSGDAYNTIRFCDMLVGARVLHGLTGDGQAQHYKRGTTNNAAHEALVLETWADGVTPAANFGVDMVMKGQSSTTESRAMARLRARWANATDAAREAILGLRVSNYQGEVEPIRIGNQELQTAIGFHAAAPITRRTHTATDELGAIDEINATLAAYGLIVDSTAVVADVTDLSSALGDRNLPPETVANVCAAANYIAQNLSDRIAEAYALPDPLEQLDVYAFFAGQHGFHLANTWALAGDIVDNEAGSGTIFTEIEDSYPDLIPAIAANIDSQSALQIWIGTYAGYSSATATVLSGMVAALTLPTWREIAFLGSLIGVETYDCDPCPIDPPVVGEWVIEWTEPGTDWTNGACGTGFSADAPCGPGTSLDIIFDPTMGGSVAEIVRVLVDVDYVGINDDIYTFSLTGHGTPVSHNLDGTGSQTFQLADTSLDLDGDIFSIALHLSSDTVFGLGDSVTITRVRIEGNGFTPPNTGVAC